MIPLSVPVIKGNEKKYVDEAISNGWVSTSGSYVTRFEHEMADYLKIKQTAAVQSGTAALHLSYLLSGVKPGQEVIVPALTFIAAVNPVKYLGAEPVFMDCDDSLNMDCQKLEDFLKKECTKTTLGLRNNKSKRIITAITVVHVFGNMADMETLVRLADEYGLKLIEDATEALGTRYTDGLYEGKFAGTMGDFGAYSFNGNKIITTGGGGLVTAKKAADVERCAYLAAQAKDDTLFYVHNHIGYNYRMTNMQAALGVGQLECLEDYIHMKEQNYNYYREGLENFEDGKLMPFNEKARNNHWFYSLLLTNKALKRDSLMKQLKEAGIESRPIWKLNHTQTMYQSCQAYYIEKAPYYQNRIINLPCSVNITEADINYVIEALRKS
ncbi:perosamine synthetase [Lacrimispora xylanisolvens]|uniref:Perosamine synthetase n=1 Tax=Lacrimispora xylanisolvens TaxID=384636 RepID=A0A2S6HU79_9FIRM|nr:LegC family aminotransferase [Hungatella xylanolytica]MBE5989771.1 LegC family aminotransferase [Paenibacillaceae bacterium]PPK81302.1 perosamine synthetase [Hungatella xylanolytica]